MIDALRLFAGWALVWAFGIAIVVAISHGVRDRAPGVSMWTIGCGFFAGAFMLPFAPDWRWGPTGSTTPWYSTARLFRQSTIGDWQTVIEEVSDALRHG